MIGHQWAPEAMMHWEKGLGLNGALCDVRTRASGFDSILILSCRWIWTEIESNQIKSNQYLSIRDRVLVPQPDSSINVVLKLARAQYEP